MSLVDDSCICQTLGVPRQSRGVTSVTYVAGPSRDLLDSGSERGRQIEPCRHEAEVVETGLRANELRTLTASSFDLEHGTVTVLAAYSKHRKEDTIPLRPETVAELKGFLTGRLLGVKAFDGRYKQLTDRTSEMLREDLAATEGQDSMGNVIVDAVPYTDAAGRFRDFHALRHTCGSWLADCGVHPKQIQEIMRHGDINLTMTRYGHSLRGREAEAVVKLPDLSLSACEVKRATGTDDSHANGTNDLAQDLALLVAPSCTTMHPSAQTIRTGAIENGVFDCVRRDSNPQPSVPKTDALSIELRTPKPKCCESSKPPSLDESGDSAVPPPYWNDKMPSNQKIGSSTPGRH